MNKARDDAPIAFGAIGCSDIAWRRTLPTINASPLTRLTCVAARDAGRAEAYANRFGCDPVEGYETLLERPDVEAVYISLPAALHAGWVDTALRAGKHVLVEKPFALGHQQGRKLFELAHERGLVLMENYAFVHHGQHDEIQRRVDKGEIGDLRTFEAAFTIPPRPPDDIRYRSDLGGSALLDNGVYPLRAAIHFLGPDLNVVGTVLREHPEHETVVSGGILLVNPDGILAHLSFGMEHAYRAEYRLGGSLGSFTLDRVFTPPPDHRCVLRIQLEGTRESVEMEPEDQFDSLIREFAGAVVEGSATAPANEASLQLTGLLDRIREEAVYVTAH